MTARAARSISWQATRAAPRCSPPPAPPARCRGPAAPRGGFADVDRAGGVGAVAVLEAAEVEHDHVAPLDGAVTGLVVRVGAVRSGADHGEVDLGVPELGEQPGQIGGHVGLLAAGEPDLEDLLVRGVGGGPRRGEPVQLMGVLDGAQHRQRLGEGGVRGPGQQLLEAEQMHGPGVVADPEAALRVEQGAVMAYGSLPSVQSRRVSAGAPTAFSASGASRVGTTSTGSWPGVRTRTVRRSVIAVG